jgi:hypothetical protein
MTDLDTRLAEILDDYKDGLLDGRDDAVEAIKELPPFKEYVAKNETWLRAKATKSHTAGQTRRG